MNAPEQVAEALAELVFTAAPSEWGDIDVTRWEEAGIPARPGAAGFVITDRSTGREWIVGVQERERSPV